MSALVLRAWKFHEPTSNNTTYARTAPERNASITQWPANLLGIQGARHHPRAWPHAYGLHCRTWLPFGRTTSPPHRLGAKNPSAEEHRTSS